MKTKNVFAAAIAGAMIWPTSRSLADEVRFPFSLPNCPSPLVLQAPDIFAGAENRQDLVEQLAAHPISQGTGTIVQAFMAPLEPSVVLVLAERNDVVAMQGKVTGKQFDHLKAALLAANGKSEVADVNERGHDMGISVSNFSIVNTLSSNESITIIGLMSGSEPGADFASYLGVLVGYAHQCIPSAIVVAPASSMSEEAFEAVMHSISFE